MHKVPPTFLQAMHRASAELGQALKSPEKATVAPEGDQLPGSSWSLFSTRISGRGSGFCSLAGRGAGREEARPSNQYHARLGCKMIGEGSDYLQTHKIHPRLCLLLTPVLFGAGHVHSGPNGLRACICLKNNNKILKKEVYQPHHCVGRAWGQHGGACGRWPTGSVAHVLVKIQPKVIPAERGSFGSHSFAPSSRADSEQGFPQIAGKSELSRWWFGFSPA